MLVLATASFAARPTADQDISVGSGTLVAFKGTSLQCLVFGPVRRVKGRNGILCFKGKPRQHAAGTRWVAMTPTTVLSSTSSTQPDYAAITSLTHIRTTVSLALGGTLTVAGLKYTQKGRGVRLGCRFQVIPAIDPGKKAVVCADVIESGPIPGGSGFVLSQRALASVTFRTGGIQVDASWRIPPCSCDK